MTDDELKELVASLAIAQQENSNQLKELRLSQQETDKQLRETDRQLKETDRQLKETDKQLRRQLKNLAEQIGGLGNKFGSFTEGWAFPSMIKVLKERFKMDAVTTNYRIKHDNKIIELDIFAHSNGELNTGYIVEVKSHVREEHIEQLLKQLTSLREFLPEHANKRFFGILAGVHIPNQLKERILQHGLYVAAIHDDHFTLQVPDDFQATAF
jgi:hypothetical protein